MATPYGIITIWNGLLSAIPLGWQVCDGTGGTPDLRSTFIMGASSDSEVNTISGCATHTHTSPGLSGVGDHSHSVSGGTSTRSATSSGASNTGSYYIAGGHSHGFDTGTSNGGGHSHTVGESGAGSVLPPYYKLFYIMKV